MIGILYTLGNIILGAASGIRGAAEDENLKQHSRKLYRQGKNPYELYVDRKGVTRLLSNGMPAKIQHDYLTGDTWLWVGSPLKPEINLTKEWRKEYYNYFRENPVQGKTTTIDIFVRYQPNRNIVEYEETSYWTNQYYAYGQWYKDLETGDLYVKRKIGCKEYYMYVKNGLLARISDEEYLRELKDETYNEDEIKQFIHAFNTKRTTMPDKYAKSYEWECFYMNQNGDCFSNVSDEERRMMGELAPRLLNY